MTPKQYHLISKNLAKFTKKWRTPQGIIDPKMHGALPDAARIYNRLSPKHAMDVILGKRNYIYRVNGKILFKFANGCDYINKDFMSEDYKIFLKAWDGLQKYHGKIPSIATMKKDPDIPNSWVDDYVKSLKDLKKRKGNPK